MAAFRVVERLDVVKHVAARRIPGHVGFLPDPFSLEQLEGAFRHGVVVAIATSAYAADDPADFRNACHSAPVNWRPWSECSISPGAGFRGQIAASSACSACSTKLTYIWPRIAQHTIWREYRFSAIARYSEPSYVRM